MTLALEPALLPTMTQKTPFTRKPLPEDKWPQNANQDGRFATKRDGPLADSRTGHAKINASEPHLLAAYGTEAVLFSVRHL